MPTSSAGSSSNGCRPAAELGGGPLERARQSPDVESRPRSGAIHGTAHFDVAERNRFLRDGEGATLVFTWTERGGPKVSAPKRGGFGTILLKKGVCHELGGKVTLDYREEGLVCTMAFPIGDKIRRA